MKNSSAVPTPKPPSYFYYYFSIFALTFLYFLVYFFHLFQPTDYDLGWHFRYGADVVHDGVIWRTNTYSTDLSGYKWTHTSWGLDIVRYLIYEYGGMIGIAVAGGLTVALTFFLIAKAFDFTLWQTILTFPILSIVMYAVNVHSLRGQQVSFFFTALLLYLLRKYEKNVISKISNFEFRISNFILYLTLPLFLIWINLNGQFMLGFAIYGVWVLFQFITYVIQFDHDRFKINFIHLKSSIVYLIVPSSLCLPLTLINPFGIRMFDDIVTMGKSPAMQFISEWVPISADSGLVWYFLLGWGLIFLLVIPILIYQSKLIRYLPYLIISLVLYVASFMQGRYVWTMFLISSPFLAILLGFLNPKNYKITAVILTILLLGFGTGLAVFELPSRDLGNISWDNYCKRTNCSIRGADYLAKNYKDSKMWTDYNYGGWLIWNYPEIKPSMDGRMSLWVDPDTGYSAFLDNYFPLETGHADPDKSMYDVFFVQNYRPLKDRLDGLVSIKKWSLVFQDERASIYVRNKISL